MRWNHRILVLTMAHALAQSAFAGEAALELHGSGAYYTLRLPLVVQTLTASADLSDLQVLNARGEPVPYAWADEARSMQAEERQHSVPFFRAPAAASAVDPAQQGGWIIDLRSVEGALLDLQLDLPTTAHGIYGMALDASADLQQWQPIRSAVQLISLQHQGLRLDSHHIDLEGVRARYLRLRTLPGSLPAPITGAQVTYVTHFSPPQPLQWSEPIAATQCTPQACDYQMPRHLPLERLEVVLSEPNTLATVELLAQYESVGTHTSPRHHHRLRDEVKGLRHKTAPAQREASAGWSPLQDPTLYWLRLPEGEAHSNPMALSGEMPSRVRLQPSGGMAQLGSQRPLIRVASRPRALVFLAREPAPYRLSWGGNSPIQPALLMSQLMPTRQTGDTLPEATASVLLAPVAEASAPVSAQPSLAKPSEPSHKLWLWGVLLTALGLMGGMAWQLLRPSPKTKT